MLLLLLLVLMIALVVVVVVEGPEARMVSGAPKLVCLRNSDPNTRLPLDSSELLDASDAVLQNGPISGTRTHTNGIRGCSW